MKDNSPSITAAGVAQGIYLRSKHPVMAQYIDATAASMAKEIATEIYSKNGLYGLGMRIGSMLPKLYEKIVNQHNYGMIDHYVMRKAALESEIKDSIEFGGVKQVVIIARGYDTLDLRLAKEHPDVKFFSIDHPATLGSSSSIFKSEKFTEKFGPTPSNITFIPLDLVKQGKELGSILKDKGFDPAKPSVTEAEGVLYYFDKHDIHNVIQSVADISIEGSRFLLTMYRTLEANGAGAKRTDKSLKSMGEPYKTAMTQQQLSEFVENIGYKVIKATKYHELQEGLDIHTDKGKEKLLNERPEDVYSMEFVGRNRTLDFTQPDSKRETPHLHIIPLGVTQCYQEPAAAKARYQSASMLQQQ